MSSFPLNRRDHSVNGAIVENHATVRPVLKTHTDVNPAGGFAGGGTGNKAILGHWLASPLALSSLVSVEFLVELLAPEAFGLGPNVKPYANLVVECDPIGDPGNYSIFVFGDVNNPLLLGAYSTPAPNQHQCLWTASDAGSGVMVVLDKKMCTFPNPPGPVIVPVSQGPVQDIASNWQAHAYSIANILVAYPSARIVNAYTGDGGLPHTPTQVSGLMMVCGSSGNFLQNAVRVLDWRLNGISI